MDGIRSRGVLVSIASFIFSSFGLALSVVGSLLDLSFGHDVVAHLLAMAAGQQKLSHHAKHSTESLASRHLHPLDAATAAARHRGARTRSPSPSRKHHQHHEHHRQLPPPASILKTSSLTSSPGHDNHASDRPQRPLCDRTVTCPSTIRSRSPIPIIAIHEPDAHEAASSDSAVSTAQGKVSKKSNRSKIPSRRDSSKYTSSAHPESSSEHPSSTLESKDLPYPASQQSSASSRPALPRSQSAYASDSEARLGRAPSLRERKPSITFLQPVRPPKDTSQDTETGGESSDGQGGERRVKTPKIPKLGTSPSQFKAQHRKRLSRCSSSPNLSTPPATPTDFTGSATSSRSTSTRSSFVMVTPEPLPAEPLPTEDVSPKGKGKSKGDKGSNSRPATPSKKMTLSGILRKIPSAPGPLAPELQTPPTEKSAKKAFAFNFSNTTPKKEKGLKTRRSQPSFTTSPSPSPPPLPALKPLRTQPYEAPYFFPMPDSVQPKPTRRKARDSSESKKTSKTPLSSRASSPDLNNASSRTMTASPPTH